MPEAAQPKKNGAKPKKKALVPQEPAVWDQYPGETQVIWTYPQPLEEKEQELCINLTVQIPTFGRPSQAVREVTSILKALAIHGWKSDRDILVTVTATHPAPPPHG